MIDKELFTSARDIARSRLPAEEAANSYGYYIDLVNHWENYYCHEKLTYWYGIHATHQPQFPELSYNLGELSEEERDWSRRYAAFCDMATKFLSTTGYRMDLKYDIAETLTDWRTLRKWTSLPARILDFGAGCARQGISAFLQTPDNVYVAVDGSLIGYTMQNLSLAVMDMLGVDGASYDYLDYDIAAKPLPRIADASPGDRFHVPIWHVEESVPERYFDIVIGAHVAFELSLHDFMRFMRCVAKGLADDGVFYMRSEISSPDYRDYFDALDLHGSNVVQVLGAYDIVPISTEYDTFLTTVFARRGSRPHQAALAASPVAEELLKASCNMDLSIGASLRYAQRRLAELVADNRRVAVFGAGATIYRQMVHDDLQPLKIAPLLEPTANRDPGLRERLLAYDPDALVIAGGDIPAQEAALREVFGDQFPLRLAQMHPLVILLRDRCVTRDPLFEQPILTAADVAPQRKVGPHQIFPASLA